LKIQKFAVAILALPFLTAGSINIHTDAADNEESPFFLESSISTEQPYTVNLSWGGIDETYSYQLFRQKEDEEWETRSIWNGSETVDVLNIYPASPYLETWMTTTISDTETPAGMGLFDIDSIHIRDFNNNPESFLLDENGSWKYDVLFFGSSDCNSYYDLNEASYNCVQSFADSGRGVLFGHDTICAATNVLHTNFNTFAPQLGLVIKTPNPEIWYISTSVSVVKTGILTNFPWNIRGTLTVPPTHATGQFNIDADEWITINAQKRVDEESGGIDNFYLVTKGNLGMIQTGNSNGQATDDERKVLANTLFYLHQKSQLTEAKDNSFYDEAAPGMPKVMLGKSVDGAMELTIDSDDYGTEYRYYILAASDANGETRSMKSNVVAETALSGIKGYVFDISTNPDPMPELVVYDENNEVVQNVNPADPDGRICFPVGEYYGANEYYLHAYAVDNENNISDEYIVSLSDESIAEPVTTTTTSITTTTTTITTTTATTASSISTSTTAASSSAEKTQSSTKTEHTSEAAETTVNIQKDASPKTGDKGVSGYVFIVLSCGAALIAAMWKFENKTEKR